MPGQENKCGEVLSKTLYNRLKPCPNCGEEKEFCFIESIRVVDQPDWGCLKCGFKIIDHGIDLRRHGQMMDVRLKVAAMAFVLFVAGIIIWSIWL